MLTWAPIPGETPIDPSGLKVSGITTRRELNIAEAKNVAKAIFKYLGQKPNRRTAPFSLHWSVDVHRHMFGDVWDWAGEYRTKEVNIGVPFATIQESLYNLLEDFKVWKGMDSVEKAVRLHHRAVQIHPFPNGNGRWSRLLANISMRLDGDTWIEWPEETIGSVGVIREAYISAVKSADNGKFVPLIEMCRRYETKI